jgi:hypothetical protein
MEAIMETISMEQDAMAQTQDLEDSIYLSDDALNQLREMNPTYPGWGLDFENAFHFYEAGDGDRFMTSCQILEEKQRAFEAFKSYNRLKALVTLILTYPGSEQDLQSAEEWNMKNVSNEESDRIFQDKLDGMKNKEAFHLKDRTYPLIAAVDKLEIAYPGRVGDNQCALSARLKALVTLVLTYPGSEEDLQSAEEWTINSVPNEENDRIFQDKLDAMKNKEVVYVRDRTHPHIVAVDKAEIIDLGREVDDQCALSALSAYSKALVNLALTYPGSEQDIQSVKEWTIKNVSNEENDRIFQDELDFMKNKEVVHVGDRTHLHIVAVDKPERIYPGGDGDFQSALPAHLKALLALVLTYPGSEQDLQSAEEWTIKNVSNEENDRIFQDKLDAMKNEETLFVRNHTHPHLVADDKLEITYHGGEGDNQCALSARLKALVALVLTYPGSEQDSQRAEEWNMKNVSNEENDMIFQDKLDFMKYKETRHVRDRTHPHIEVDKVEITYPGLEGDDQCALPAHLEALLALVLTYHGSQEDLQSAEEWTIKNASNEENDRIFQDKLDAMKNKETLFVGDRTHPHVVAVDKAEITDLGMEGDYQCDSSTHLKALVALALTYPGSEHDLQNAEEWTIRNVPNEESDRIFQDKLDGMKYKETLYVGDHTHPDIVAVDKLHITDRGFEGDNHCALSTHLKARVALVLTYPGLLTYPGSEQDLQSAEEWTINNVSNEENDRIFHDKLDDMKNKEMLHVGDGTYPHIVAVDKPEITNPGLEGDNHCALSAHLKARVALVLTYPGLTYPGSEQDIKSAEEWTINNVSNEENDRNFQDKLDGMKNKETLYGGNRTHPHIVAIDKLAITYPGWENDYQCALSAHCEAPSARFPDAFHALREKQQVFSGDRSHWRLVQLDKMPLSYPGWEEDVKEVEEWHLQNAVNATNNDMFNEVLEGMKDQQMICMDWDHDSLTETHSVTDLDSPSSYSSKSTSSAQDGSISTLEKEEYPAEIAACYQFPKFEREEDSAEIAACYQGCYRSISESLETHEKKKKKLVEERSQSRPRTPEPESHTRTLFRPSRILASKSWFAPRPARRQGGHDSTDNGSGDDKRVNLGKCVVCLNRRSTHLFVPCGHLCACAPCGTRAMKTTAACPICRGEADRIFRVFLT